MPKTPTSFIELSEADLKVAADFFGTDAEGGKEVIIAGLAESGVTFDQYEQLVLKKEVEAPAETVTEITIKEKPVEQVVVTAPERPVLEQADYLIKMERKNPYFEHGKYKFTAENPYNIMPAEDAQDILVNETGFRQAFPDELKEYYG